MTSCEYCEREGVWYCHDCGAELCEPHLVVTTEDDTGGQVPLCNPDPATWPGRGCYKPPVSETNDQK